MTKLDVYKELARRRRRKVEINKNTVDSIQYHAAIRTNIDREHMRVERHRLQGLLQTPVANPMLLRHRYEELTKALAK